MLDRILAVLASMDESILDSGKHVLFPSILFWFLISLQESAQGTLDT